LAVDRVRRGRKIWKEYVEDDLRKRGLHRSDVLDHVVWRNAILRKMSELRKCGKRM